MDEIKLTEHKSRTNDRRVESRLIISSSVIRLKSLFATSKLTSSTELITLLPRYLATSSPTSLSDVRVSSAILLCKSPLSCISTDPDLYNQLVVEIEEDFATYVTKCFYPIKHELQKPASLKTGITGKFFLRRAFKLVSSHQERMY